MIYQRALMVEGGGDRGGRRVVRHERGLDLGKGNEDLREEGWGWQ